MARRGVVLAALVLGAAPHAEGACVPVLDPAAAALETVARSRPSEALPRLQEWLARERDPLRRVELRSMLGDIYLVRSMALDFRRTVLETRTALADLGALRDTPRARRVALRVSLDEAHTAIEDADKRASLAALERLLSEYVAPTVERACVLTYRAEKLSDLGEQYAAATDAMTAHQLSRTNGWDEPLVSSSTILAIAYRRGALFDRAEAYADEAVAAATRLGSTGDLAIATYMQSLVRLDRNRPGAARESAARARAHFLAVDNRFGAAVSDQVQCRALIRERLLDEAERVCMSDDVAATNAGRADAIASTQLDVAELALARGDIAKARHTVVAAERLPATVRTPTFDDRLYSLTAQIASAAGDYRRAFEYTRRLADSVERQRAAERASSLAVLTAAAGVERLRSENARLVAEGRQQAARLASEAGMRRMQTLVAIAGVSILLLLLVIAGGSRRYLRERQQRSEIVAERTRIAGEMHDTLLQQFAGLTLQFEAALHDAPPMLRQRFHVLLAQSDRVLREARQAVWGLRSTALEQATFGAALDALVAHWQRPDGPAIELAVEPDLPDLPPSLETTFVRILQEALSNAVRHAGARRIEIRVALAGRAIVGRVADDGRGFDTGVRVSGHFGLANMLDLARRQGGTLDVASSPGSGTTIEVRMPLGRRVRRRGPRLSNAWQFPPSPWKIRS